MSKIIATQQLTFDDFHKDEYRAFQLEAQNVCLSLPSIVDRLKEMLMEVERQMEAGDHLSITLSVSRPSDNPFDVADQILRTYGYNPIGRSHP